MGTKMAPAYANIFMGKFEERLLETSIERPLSWYRFIDDVDMKWNKGEDALLNFITHANNQHPSIKFTHEASERNINFLDTCSTIKNGHLSVDIYSKPTDTHQYLSPKSCHPPHCTKSIPYSQALRIRRICSNEETSSRRLNQLNGHLKNRGYKHKIIKEGFKKAKSQPRADLLQYKQKQKSKRVPCVITYHPSMRHCSRTILRHWPSVEKSSKLSKIFPDPPMVAFKQPDSLKSHLVRAEMGSSYVPSGENRPCGDKRCKCCRHIQPSSTFQCKTTRKTYKIFCSVNCKSSNVIYLLECAVCGLQYVGESKQQFNRRLNGHRSDLNIKPYLPVSQHFRLPGHNVNDFQDMKVTIIEQDHAWKDSEREARESFWIQELGVLYPSGINKKK